VRYADVEPVLRTGDILLFHGASRRSHVIETATASRYSHVGMIVRPDPTRPPLLWHTDPRPVTLDVEDGEAHPGAQLNDLRAALARMTSPQYGDTPSVRRLEVERTPALEEAVRRAVATIDRTAFPSLPKILKDWVLGHLRVGTREHRMECAEVLAYTYQQMGLLPAEPPSNAYAPRDFHAGTIHGRLLHGASLSDPVEVL